MEPYFAIEHPAYTSQGELVEGYAVYRYSEYPESSVLAGRQRRSFQDSFPSLEEARQAFPSAEWGGDNTSSAQEVHIPVNPPEWFDETLIGERWSEDY